MNYAKNIAVQQYLYRSKITADKDLSTAEIAVIPTGLPRKKKGIALRQYLLIKICSNAFKAF